MLDKIKYVNSRNETITFGQFPYFANYNDFRDYEWSFDKYSGYERIARFKREIGTKSLPVVIAGPTTEAVTEAKNKLHDVLDIDVIEKQNGRLYIGDYYMEGFFIGSVKSKYLENGRYAVVNLKFVAEKSRWIRETDVKFFTLADSETSGGTDSRDYPHKYPYDYMQDDTYFCEINNDTITDAAFKLIVNGYCENPSIVIGGNLYEVYTTIDTDEYLVIDAFNKEAWKVDVTGKKTSVFGFRNKDYDLFKKIPQGNQTVVWEGDFNFSIMLLEERSEPKWI